MNKRLTEVRRFSDGRSWVVDILAARTPTDGYGQPDGTAGEAYHYGNEAEAETAAVLYTAKQLGVDIKTKTSAGESKPTCGECIHFDLAEIDNCKQEDFCTKGANDFINLCEKFELKSSTEGDGIQKFGHPDFYKLLEQIAGLHSRKSHDYSGTKDPLKNLRACERLNLEPFLGVLVRLQDKWSRLEEFVSSGQLMVKNESVIDTLMDNAVYSLLAIILYQEQLKNKTSGG